MRGKGGYNQSATPSEKNDHWEAMKNMENALQETNEMILDAEEKNREGNDGSNVLTLQGIVFQNRRRQDEKPYNELCELF
jgi:hypothetical protein